MVATSFNMLAKSFDDGTASPQWKTLSLTHVAYPSGDTYGKFLALFTMLPFAIVVAFTALTLFIRDVHVISFFLGQLLNELANFLLKHHVREPRPQQVKGEPNENSTSYGWPSSHCQFQAFFFTYSMLCIFLRMKQTHPLVPRWSLALANILALGLIVQSRIYLRYHYPYQCWHALLLGSSVAMAWFLVVTYAIEPFVWSPLLAHALNTKYLWLVSKYFNLNTNTTLVNVKHD